MLGKWIKKQIEVGYDFFTYSLDCSEMILRQSHVVDPFWKQPPNEGKPQLTTTISSSRVCVPAKPMSTMEERSAAIMSSFQIVAQIASTSSSSTAIVLAELGGLIDRLSIKQDGKHNHKRIEPEFKDVQAMEHVCNPPVHQKQSQARKQPSAIGAPTTSSYKAAGARSSPERKQTMKAKEPKALGRS